jgi:23S rRNA maturation mini-RNase III
MPTRVPARCASDRDYRAENRALRDAARAFSAARDVAVLVETLEELMQKAKGTGVRRGLAAFEAQLRENAERERYRLGRRGLQVLLMRL